MKNFRENWLTYIITIIIGVVVPFTVVSFTDKTQQSRDINVKIDSKLDKSEFFSEKKNTKEYIDQQNYALFTSLQVHTKEDERREELIIKWLESIDKKVSK